MATQPAPPTFSAGAPSIAQLNALSYAVSFIADMDVRPFFHFVSENTQAVSSNTWTTISMSKVAYDNDATFQTGGAAKIVTQGYYTLTGCAEFRCTTTEMTVSAAFLMTGGSSNPHLSSGSTKRFGYRGDSTQNATASADTTLCVSDTTPFPCYPGDTLQLQVYCTGSSITLDYNTGATYEEGHFVPNFTGYFVRTGT